jgi:hypothetical protein
MFLLYTECSSRPLSQTKSPPRRVNEWFRPSVNFEIQLIRFTVKQVSLFVRRLKDFVWPNDRSLSMQFDAVCEQGLTSMILGGQRDTDGESFWCLFGCHAGLDTDKARERLEKIGMLHTRAQRNWPEK